MSRVDEQRTIANDCCEPSDEQIGAALRAGWSRNAWVRPDDLAFEQLGPVARMLAGSCADADRAAAADTLHACPEIADTLMRVLALVAQGELASPGRGIYRVRSRLGQSALLRAGSRERERRPA